jgi:hypothetical protein
LHLIELLHLIEQRPRPFAERQGGVAAIVVALVPLGIALLLLWARFG